MSEPGLEPPDAGEGWLAPSVSVETLLNDQRQRWVLGERVRVEEYLRRQSWLVGDPEKLLDLIHAEVVLRKEAGEAPRVEEYLGQFPGLARELVALFEIEGVIDEGGFPSTDTVGSGGREDGPTILYDRPREEADLDPVAAVLDRWRPGDVILGLYEVMHVHESGGMGLVYRVRHRQWDVDLAVKSPRPEFFHDDRSRENFEREAETWVNLGQHPHTVSCYYVRRLGGIPRVFAEYVEGGSLADWIREGTLYQGGAERALARILDMAIQVAWGCITPMLMGWSTRM
jgi:hypothetical protein